MDYTKLCSVGLDTSHVVSDSLHLKEDKNPLDSFVTLKRQQELRQNPISQPTTSAVKVADSKPSTSKPLTKKVSDSKPLTKKVADSKPPLNQISKRLIYHLVDSVLLNYESGSLPRKEATQVLSEFLPTDKTIKNVVYYVISGDQVPEEVCNEFKKVCPAKCLEYKPLLPQSSEEESSEEEPSEEESSEEEPYDAPDYLLEEVEGILEDSPLDIDVFKDTIEPIYCSLKNNPKALYKVTKAILDGLHKNINNLSAYKQIIDTSLNPPDYLNDLAEGYVIGPDNDIFIDPSQADILTLVSRALKEYAIGNYAPLKLLSMQGLTSSANEQFEKFIEESLTDKERLDNMRKHVAYMRENSNRKLEKDLKELREKEAKEKKEEESEEKTPTGTSAVGHPESSKEDKTEEGKTEDSLHLSFEDKNLIHDACISLVKKVLRSEDCSQEQQFIQSIDPDSLCSLSLEPEAVEVAPNTYPEMPCTLSEYNNLYPAGQIPIEVVEYLQAQPQEPIEATNLELHPNYVLVNGKYPRIPYEGMETFENRLNAEPSLEGKSKIVGSCTAPYSKLIDAALMFNNLHLISPLFYKEHLSDGCWSFPQDSKPSILSSVECPTNRITRCPKETQDFSIGTYSFKFV